MSRGPWPQILQKIEQNNQHMVEVNGIEPMTSCVQGRRSPS